MNVLNFALFQGAWFGCVLGGARGFGWAGAASALPVLAQSVWSSADRNAEARALAAAAALGALGEFVLSRGGALAFPGGSHLPVSIVALWLAFAATFSLSLAWLASRPLVAAAFALVGSPMSYLGAERLGAVAVADGMLPLAAIGAVWAVTMPGAALLYRRAGGGRR